MTDQTPIDTMMRGVIPYIMVEGASDASTFYQRAFGAQELMRTASDDASRLIHCRLVINGGILMMSDCFPEQGFAHEPSSSFTMQLIVDDIDAWWKRAVEAGAEVVMPVQKMFWGDRYGQLRDPFKINWAMNEPAAAA